MTFIQRVIRANGSKMDARETVDLMIVHGTVLTMDRSDRVVDRGAVAIHDNKIVDVGDGDTLLAQYQPANVIDAANKVVLPGLIDTYGHAGHGLIRGLFDPDAGWPAQHLYWHATTPQWWAAEARLAAVERLRFGVTTGMSVIGASPARMDSPVFAIENAEAYAEVGVRAVLGVGPPDPVFSHLPERWTGRFLERGRWVEREFTYDDTIANSTEVIRVWNGAADGRIRVAMACPYLFGRHVHHARMRHRLPGPRDVPQMRAHAEQMRALTDQFGILLHTHMFRGSVDFALQHFGRAEVEGLLGPDVLIAHGNGLGPTEIETIGAARCGVAAVSFTHENIWYGVAPIVALIDAGAKVTISTDGAAPYASFDLWRELSRATWNQWIALSDQRALPPGKVLRMVTIEAAEALCMADEIGSLEVGKKADVITVDLAAAHLTPRTSIPRLLAYYATGHDVADVVVDGRVLMRDRRILSVDVSDVIGKAQAEAERAFALSDVDKYLRADRATWRGARSKRA